MNRDFKGIWIPKEIWLHPTLSVQAKCLWAEIDSLFDEEKGGCHASDDYLSEFLGVKLSRFKEVLKELRDSGLVENVSFNGRKRVMKALSPHVAGEQLAGKPASSQPESRLPDSRKTGFTPYIENKDEKKEEKSKGASTPARADSSKEPPKKERAPHVFTTDQEHERLAQKYSRYIRDKAYTYLSEWKVDTPQTRWKKDDNRAIQRWVIDALQEEKVKQKKRQEIGIEEDNISYAQRIAENFNLVAVPRGIRIDVTSQQIEFVALTAQMPPVCIPFHAKGFKEQVDNTLRKWRLK